ncbi:MAG: hypothetical protein ACXAAQ_14600, partial [Candidatus Thorarchaeota archaeon]
ALFLEPSIAGVVPDNPTGTGFLIYLPPVIVATSIGSLLFATLGIFLVTVTDDTILSSILGSLLTIGLELIVWMNSLYGIPLLSPRNFMSIFAGLISGYDSPNDYAFAEYFGVLQPLSLILIILAFFGFIAFFGIVVSNKILQRNSMNWKHSMDDSVALEIWDVEPERRQRKIRQRLRIRRISLVGIVICLLIVMSYTTDSYAATLFEQTRFTLHESPEGGEAVNLGEWYVLSLVPHPPQFGLRNYFRWRLIIEDWGTSPDNVDFHFEIINMTSSDFESLNETSRRFLLRNRSLVKPARGYIPGIFAAWSDGPFTFAMKAVASENETLSGVLHCSLVISQFSET